MPIVEPPPPLPEDASPGQRELHAQAVERWLTEGGRPVTPRANEDATMAALLSSASKAMPATISTELLGMFDAWEQGRVSFGPL